MICNYESSHCSCTSKRGCANVNIIKKNIEMKTHKTDSVSIVKSLNDIYTNLLAVDESYRFSVVSNASYGVLALFFAFMLGFEIYMTYTLRETLDFFNVCPNFLVSL